MGYHADAARMILGAPANFLASAHPTYLFFIYICIEYKRGARHVKG